MLIKAVLDRITAQMPQLGTVGSLAGLEDNTAKRSRARLPAAFAYEERRSAGANRAVGAVSQQVDKTVSVALVAENRADPSRAVDVLDGLVEDLDGALIGWSPDDEHSMLEASDGQIVEVADGVVTRIERYRTTTQIHAHAQKQE